ncbi:HEAT repeat domain-containing protein [Sulfidibacter corallicola]|uniref:HEAT repeat domain-containing protein n=1 Tax=Sulfidibacter corallicola TaxID=2818388 RepID=A0A8A4TTR5_SULCO|nr:HEAT repeat domain-containing protein [Sulfidibacter corallicola]QTD52920.1 HEAT repeat domain-containing protein [Sulfidibacter corallicola]
MFESSKSRKEFLQAILAGRINAQLLQKAMGSYQSFADADLADVLPLVTHPQAKKFGAALVSVNRDPQKLSRLMDLFTRERRPEAESDILAAIAVCKAGDTRSLVAKMTNDKNVDVRKKALKLLIRLEDWARQRDLVGSLLLDPNPSISEAMIRQLVSQEATAPYAAALRQLALHDQESIRDASLKALIKHKNPKNIEVFLQALAHSQGEVKQQLEAAISGFISDDPSATGQQIIGALTDPDDKVVETALRLYLTLPNQAEAFRNLLSFTDSVTAFMRDEVFKRLIPHQDYIVPLVLDLCRLEQNPALKLQALNLAKVLKNNKLAPLFLHELKNPDWMVRYSAMQVLAAMRSPQALPILVEFLNDSDSSMAAIQALDQYRDMRLAKPFFQKLSAPDANESEQIELLKALRNLGDQRFLPHLAKFLEGPLMKGKARKLCAEVIIAICDEKNVQVPESVRKLHESLSEKTLEDLPDLGLKLSDG